jgi:serine/threonine protein kinase
MDHNNLCTGCFEDSDGQNACSHCGYEKGTAPVSAHHLAPGTLLENKYRLGRVLGQGGFGITYIAWDQKLEMKLAIKEYFPQGMAARTPGRAEVDNSSGEIKEQLTFGLQRFLNEAKTLARFAEHPNIVTVRDYFEANGTAYLVMSYVEGVTLEQYLHSRGGRLSFDNCLEIIMPVLDALKEVHRVGVMHRDISPDNIFIKNDGRVILIDFGAARQEMREKSKSLSVILKAGYAPPEQYQSRGKQGPWTDVYAVAATMYRAVTGQTPLEAIDRLDEDDLVPPSQLGVVIEPKQEQALLKALALKARNRYQAVEEFQDEIVASPARSQVSEGYAGVRPKEATGLDDKEDIKSSKAEPGQKGAQGEAIKEAEKKPEPAEKPAGWAPQVAPAYSVSKRFVKTAALVLLCGLLIFGAVSLFSGGDEVDEALPIMDTDEAVSEEGTEEAAQTYDSAVIAGLNADYYIDFDNGTIPIGDLPIGARVVDPGWEWEFRTGRGYAREEGDQTKPVTWIVVAKDRYEGLESHVTLLSEELIGLHAFDNSTHVTDYGYNRWGASGTVNADRGLRPWLNSSVIHSGEGFYRAFSESFTGAVLTTTVPNKEWESGSAYSTQDKVFIPSTTELGDTEHNRTYRIGSAYPYFQGADDAKRIARLAGETKRYWSRSPDSGDGYSVRRVATTGAFDGRGAHGDINGVRPALNLKSGILVSEINP